MEVNTTERQRYSDAALEDFRKIIEDKIKKAQSDLDLIKSACIHNGYNGTNDTSPEIKPWEETNQLVSKKNNNLLAIRQEKFIRDLENAITRINNKTYGICRVTEKLINPERLKLVPHATLSIEAKNMQS